MLERFEIFNKKPGRNPGFLFCHED